MKRKLVNDCKKWQNWRTSRNKPYFTTLMPASADLQAEELSEGLEKED